MVKRLDFLMEGGETESDVQSSVVEPVGQWRDEFLRAFQYYLDRSIPHTLHRWLGTLGVAAIYVLRVYCVRGF